MHIDQGVVDANGNFRIPIPAGLEGQAIRCNLRGEPIYADCLYASNDGSADGIGTASAPLSFQTALERANDGDWIVVMDEIILPAGFVWPAAQKNVIVTGGGEGAALNLYQLPSQTLNIHTGAAFENLALADSESGKADKKGTIRACGNVVTRAESVTTNGFLSAFYGGARNWDTVEKTETYIYGGNFNRIYGGGGRVLGDCKLTVGGNTNTTAGVDPSLEKNGIFEPYIYGGTLDNVVDGDCITTITGKAGAQYLYGGSQDVKENGDRGSGVKGKTVVNLQGGKFMNVYGMNPPTAANDISDVTINMTGGTVEALIGSSADTLADSIKGSVTINALGGTITRRMIGGVYNRDGWYSDNGQSIIGDVNIVIGPALQGMTDTQAGHGIFGGSRIKTNPTDENAKLIFVDGAYDTFKGHINADLIDCKSHHDYLVTGTSGGSINPKPGKVVEIIPDTGYAARLDASVIGAGDYTLSQERTDVEFSRSAGPQRNALYSLDGSSAAGGVIKTAVSYLSESDGNLMMLALYEGGNLAAIEQAEVKRGTHADQEITMPFIAESGKMYTLKAFLWSGIGEMVPLCESREAAVRAQ